ncbi:MAG TPA: hypothetical protein VLM85_06215 [Polyangiaceae bacterium]|nr:hypothetical protein [Polyangiaceae bacterium]
MQQPYRQMVHASGAPVTCLDPPRAPPCADEPPPRAGALHKLWSLAPAAFFFGLLAAPALAVALAATHAHTGKVEIGPAALARLRARRLATPPARIALPPPAPQPSAAAPPRTIAPWFDSSEHDPAKMVAGARRVQAMGVDLTVVDVELPRSTIDCFDTFGYWPAVALPTGTHTTALDLGDLPSDSPAIAAGLQKHDLLLSIDGYPVDGWKAPDIERIRGRGSLALEIERNGRRILLTIHWRTKWRPA